MKILLATTYILPKIGGVEKRALKIATHLAKRHEVHLLTTGGNETIIQDGFTIHKIPEARPLLFFYSTFKKSIIRDSFKGHHFDIMHCKAGPWWRILPKLISHDKMIITCHGSDIYPKQLKTKLITEPALKLADLVTTESKWMHDYLKTKYGIESTIIPAGVDESFRPMYMKRDENTILYVGRLLEKKGVLDLLEVAKELPQYNFHFVGKGELADKITLPNTKYLGFVPAEELPKLYNTATISVFPSHREPFGIVGLEAMACGCPVIVTNTGFAEYVEHNETGIIIEPKSQAEIVNSIKQLMGNKALREKIGKNAIRAARQYTWDIVTRKYEKIYEGVMRNDIQN